MSKKVELYYDKLSVVYDQATTGKFAWNAPKDAYSLIEPYIRSGQKVLDLGAGTGQTVDLFVKRDCWITAVDISARMLEVLSAKYPVVDCRKLDLDKDLSTLQPSFFEIVMAVGVLEFVEDFAKTVGEIRSLMRSEGLFCFSIEEFKMDHPWQSLRQSPCGINIKDPEDLANFSVRRFERADIQVVLDSHGFELVKDFGSLAYYKSEAMIPIYYRYYLARVR